jgi:hypothetical protein
MHLHVDQELRLLLQIWRRTWTSAARPAASAACSTGPLPPGTTTTAMAPGELEECQAAGCTVEWASTGTGMSTQRWCCSARLRFREDCHL